MIDTLMLQRAGSMSRYKEFVMLAICDNATLITEFEDDDPDDEEGALQIAGD